MQPFKTEFELDFSCSGENTEKFFVFDPSAAVADKLLKKKRNIWTIQEASVIRSKVDTNENIEEQPKEENTQTDYSNLTIDAIPNNDNVDTKPIQSPFSTPPQGNLPTVFQLPTISNPNPTITFPTGFAIPAKQPIEPTPQEPQERTSNAYVDLGPDDSLNSEDEEEILALDDDDDVENSDLSDEQKETIISLLTHFELSKHADIFILNQIQPDMLPALTNSDLTAIGIPNEDVSKLLTIFQNPYVVESKKQPSPSYREISYKELQIEENTFASGAFGDIYRARWRGQSVAVKMLKVKPNLDKHDIEELRREALITEKVSLILIIYNKTTKKKILFTKCNEIFCKDILI